jgi:DnaJ-class molecular chaperone
MQLDYPTTLEALDAKRRELVKIHHPDKGGDRHMFEQVQDAYTALKPAAENYERDGYMEEGFIEGRHPDTLGRGFSPPMPECLTCEGKGFHYVPKMTTDGFQPCERCKGSGDFYPWWTHGVRACKFCRGSGMILRELSIQVRIICRSCEGEGQIYISNPIVQVNTVI